MDEYPLLNLFWTMLWFFLWILWLFLLFKVLTDIFRSHDLGGWGKAGWVVLVVVLPYLGVLIYVIARGQSMSRREVKAAQEREDAMRDYIRDAAAGGGGGGGHADQLARLADLRERGSLTEEEFQQAKAKLLAS